MRVLAVDSDPDRPSPEDLLNATAGGGGCAPATWAQLQGLGCDDWRVRARAGAQKCPRGHGALRAREHKWENVGARAVPGAPEGEGRPRPRSGHTMVCDEARGKAIMFGGLGNNNQVSEALFNDTWVYHIAAGRWEKIDAGGDVPLGLFGHTASLVQSAIPGSPEHYARTTRMIIFGGQDAEEKVVSTMYVLEDVFGDLGRPRWRLLNPSGTGLHASTRWGHSMVRVFEPPAEGAISAVTLEPVSDEGEEHLVVHGGMSASFEALDDVVAYDVRRGTWRLLEAAKHERETLRLNVPNRYQGLAVDGSWLPITLASLNGDGTFRAKVYHHSGEHVWPRVHPLNVRFLEGLLIPGGHPIGRRRHTATLDRSMRMWLFGGRNQGTFRNDMWCFDLRSRTWYEVSRPPVSGHPSSRGGQGPPVIAKWPPPRTGHCMVHCEGALYTFGGFEARRDPISGNTDFILHNDVYRFDLNTCDWVEVVPERAAFQLTGGFGAEVVSAMQQTHCTRHARSADDTLGNLCACVRCSGRQGGGGAPSVHRVPAGGFVNRFRKGAFAAEDTQLAHFSLSNSDEEPTQLLQDREEHPPYHCCPGQAKPCEAPKQRTMAAAFIFNGRVFLYGGRDTQEAFDCFFSIPLRGGSPSTLVQFVAQWMVAGGTAYRHLDIPRELVHYLDTLYAPAVPPAPQLRRQRSGSSGQQVSPIVG
eukprot:TRINITY_DN12153_c2_g1_i2.p1 TRINITY_DN12153_c2_g1~~TRINITY_DN12153_c2_g1_i2.p1  ORF type:complete len:699 (+),score=219.04 TRINITY_DN12153_c2_g1_i2:406-2502(+)